MERKVEELKPCPFCGSDAFAILNPIKRRPDGQQGMYKVECAYRHEGCSMNMRTHYHVEASEAKTAWNNRVGD